MTARTSKLPAPAPTPIAILAVEERPPEPELFVSAESELPGLEADAEVLVSLVAEGKLGFDVDV